MISLINDINSNWILIDSWWWEYFSCRFFLIINKQYMMIMVKCFINVSWSILFYLIDTLMLYFIIMFVVDILLLDDLLNSFYVDIQNNGRTTGFFSENFWTILDHSFRQLLITGWDRQSLIRQCRMHAKPRTI